MKLFCFPFAGGSALAYRRWRKFAREGMDVIGVELPGRGFRFDEELCNNMSDLIDDLYEKLKDVFCKEEYMLYGHSMGSLIAYNLINKILKEKNRLPSRIFISGTQSPDIKVKEEISYKTKDDEFIDKVYKLGGTPKEILENKEMLELYLPILKNDFKLIQTWQYEKPIKKYNFDITIFNGNQDKIIEEDINGWKKYTNKKFRVYSFEGGHFFINDHMKELLEIIYDQSIEA